ncbi:MAG: cation diffusion facilitator family transporter, partial [Bdellovibrionota bacterium]
LALKWVAYFVSSSTALKSDAYESIVNVIAGMFGLGALLFSAQPADAEHPYGHGKIENFSAAFEGGLIALASALIAYEGFASLLREQPMHALGLGMIINAGAGLLNGGLGLGLLLAGRRFQSAAMRADGLHLLSDFWTTLGMLAGLAAVAATGALWLDSVIAIAIAGLLAWTGFRLVRESSHALLDAEDPKILSALAATINQHRKDSLIAIHELRTFRSGHYTHVDIHVVMPEFLPLRQTHDEVDRFAQACLASSGVEGEFHSHIDPCLAQYCNRCFYEPCSIRSAPALDQKQIWRVAELTQKGPEGI